MALLDLLLRTQKGSALTTAELDSNFSTIDSAIAAGTFGPATTIASAPTTNIGAASSRYVVISGTTTISSFGVVASGIERLIRFSGSLLLTYDSTSLVLPGSASIQTAANDFCLAVSDGSGNWRVTSYWRATGRSFGITAGAVTSSRSINYAALPSSEINSQIFENLYLFGSATKDGTYGMLSPNRITITGDIVSADDFLCGFQLLQSVGGTGQAGGRVGIYARMAVNGPVSPGTSTANSDVVAIHGSGYSTASQGGTGTFVTDIDSGYKGKLTGINPQVWLASGATYQRTLVGQEINVSILSGASSYAKFGVFIAKTAGDAVRGTGDDAAIAMSDQNSVSATWQYGIQFGASWGNWPFASNSTLIGTKQRTYPTLETTPAANFGVDFSGVSFSGAAFKSAGFQVDPDGDVTAKTILTTPVAVASLPSAAAGLNGARAFVTDANATTFNSVVASGGSNKVPVFCDGTNWRIG